MGKVYDLEELREAFPKILETQPEVTFFIKIHMRYSIWIKRSKKKLFCWWDIFYFVSTLGKMRCVSEQIPISNTIVLEKKKGRFVENVTFSNNE
jgi:hypothetical protein